MIGRIILFALVLAAAGLIASAGLAWMMALALLKPPRMGPGRAIYFLRRLAPADLGLQFEDLHFLVTDQRTQKKLRLAAWWIPAAGDAISDRCALLIHGYSDAKVGAIAWAPMLRELGFNILAIDLRAHGESQGELTSAGFWERHDMSQVLDQIKADRPRQTRKIVLLGISLGAAVAAATAVLRDDIAAVVLECPFSYFGQAAMNQADRQGMPGKIFQRLALWLAGKIAGADFVQVAPVNLIPKIACPVLVIQSTDDPFVLDADLAAIAAAVAANPRGVLWRAEGVHHVLAMQEDPDAYFRQLRDFLTPD